MPLIDHMEALWRNIGFKPASFNLQNDSVDHENEKVLMDVPIMTENRFPPTLVRQEPCNEDFLKCDGITVKNIPKHVEEKSIWEFLVDNGLPLDHGIENIRINMGEKNSWAIINGLESAEVKKMFYSLHFPVTDKKFLTLQFTVSP